MSKVLELKRSRKELVAQLQALAEKPTLTAEEQRTFDEGRARAADVAAQIERLEFVDGERAVVAAVDPVPSRPAPASPASLRPGIENPGFASLGELVYCSRFQPHDRRIQALMEMGTGESGGLMVPDEHNPMLREVSPQEAIWRPRATVVPGGEMPDATMTLPALNQGAGSNMYGGVEVDWIAEGGDKPETQGKLREVSWKPKEVAGHIVVTDALLRNWKAAGTFLDMLLRRALLAAEDVAFMSGNGVGRPRGVLASACLKKVNRAVANEVAYEDLVAMEAELHEDGPSNWVVSKRAIPQLRLMKDDAGQLIWNDNARTGGVPTLLGREVLVSFRSPPLGSLGDVLLTCPSHYVIKDGAPLQIAASEHVLFKQNKTVVKGFKTVDGGPWLDGPIEQEDGQTYSPFVALDVP